MSAFEPGALWLDNNGRHINAHGGGMLFHGGVYYWYGEHKIEGGAGNVAHVGMHCYVRLVVPAGAAPLTLESVQATLQHYPVNEVGTFSRSDPQLNKIWEIAAYSTKLCMQQYYEDGIKRDGLLWISDYRVQYLSNALLYGDRDLARKSLLLMAASQNPDGSIPAQASRAGASQHPSNIDYMPGIPRGVNNWILMETHHQLACQFVQPARRSR